MAVLRRHQVQIYIRGLANAIYLSDIGLLGIVRVMSLQNLVLRKSFRKQWHEAAEATCRDPQRLPPDASEVCSCPIATTGASQESHKGVARSHNTTYMYVW